MTMHISRRAAALIVGVPAVALVATACSSTGGGSAPTSSTTTMPSSASVTPGPAAAGAHNSADVAFATDMIPHHEQAVQMSAMANTRATDSRVKRLAVTIADEQTPEVSAMSGWLIGWKQPVPSRNGGMAMGSGQGMMSEQDMTSLAAATGARFDHLWVQMMITHHTGAITMARAELGGGVNPTARALAGSIVTSQSAQISTMQSLLAALPTG